MDFKSFSEDLRDYEENKKRLLSIKSELENLFYEMTGVKGISYSKAPSSHNESIAEQVRLKLIEDYNNLLADYNYYSQCIDNVERAKTKMPKYLWFMCVMKFQQGKTYEEVGQAFGFSGHGAMVHMKTRIGRII